MKIIKRMIFFILSITILFSNSTANCAAMNRHYYTNGGNFYHIGIRPHDSKHIQYFHREPDENKNRTLESCAVITVTDYSVCTTDLTCSTYAKNEHSDSIWNGIYTNIAYVYLEVELDSKQFFSDECAVKTSVSIGEKCELAASDLIEAVNADTVARFKSTHRIYECLPRYYLKASSFHQNNETVYHYTHEETRIWTERE